MELKVLKCPNCGANTTNAQNCEYCGSLLVRFVDRGIDISNTTYQSQNPHFSVLLAELKRNLQLQNENPEINYYTRVMLRDNGGYTSVTAAKSKTDIWRDDTPVTLGSDDGGLCILLGFSFHKNKEYAKWLIDMEGDTYYKKEEDKLASFRQLTSYPLFTSHVSEDEDAIYREFAIDFGKDPEGAAALFSEILTEVEGLNSLSPDDICTGSVNELNQWHDAWVKKEKDAWLKAHGLPVEDANTEANAEAEDERIPWYWWVTIGVFGMVILKILFGSK